MSSWSAAPFPRRPVILPPIRVKYHPLPRGHLAERFGICLPRYWRRLGYLRFGVWLGWGWRCWFGPRCLIIEEFGRRPHARGWRNVSCTVSACERRIEDCLVVGG